MNLRAEWYDAGRETICAPDPAYPDGIDLDLSRGHQSCTMKLAYPAKRCGYYFVTCPTCGADALITTAGRPDDPRSVKLRCKLAA